MVWYGMVGRGGAILLSAKTLYKSKGNRFQNVIIKSYGDLKMGITLSLLKTVTKRSSNIVKQFVKDIEKGNVKVGEVWHAKSGSKNVSLRIKQGTEGALLLDKHVASKYLSQQTRFQFHPQTGKLMNTWRKEQSANGYIRQMGNTHSGIEYGVFETPFKRFMFNGDFKNPKNVCNMMTGEKVSSDVIRNGLDAIRSKTRSLNIHLDSEFI